MQVVEIRLTYPNHGRPWHRSSKKWVKTLFTKKEWSIDAIASKLGRSGNSIIAQLREAGVLLPENGELAYAVGLKFSDVHGNFITEWSQVGDGNGL
jgi:hypothetical protein